MNIRFIFFDLGNVLLRFSIQRLAKQGAELTGCTEDEVLHAVFSNDMERKLECGEISEQEFYESFCNVIGKQPEPSQLANALNDIFEVIEEIQPFLKKLTAADFPRGILSNTGPGHWNHCIKKYPFLLQHFPKNHVLSFRAGAMKPDRKIYETALKTALQNIPDIKPKEILFIDDLEPNVAGAKDFGFDSFQFVSEQQLFQELESRAFQELAI
ncbi:MAG: HAD family phosphatase [Planctomycetaceae bacterium]|jgi:FMN phosphatase YigB (HAD superfamily)|nr:HAD family phosphatase [Planctomycetaceae bacterium]